MIKGLIEKCCRIKGISFVIGNKYAVGEMKVPQELTPVFEDTVMHLYAGNWDVHLNMTEVKRVQFTRDKEPSGYIPYLLFISLRDKDDQAILSLFFPNPYLDENHKKTDFQKDKQDLFDKIKDEFVNGDNIVYLEK